MKLKKILLIYIHFFETIHSNAWNQNIEILNILELDVFFDQISKIDNYVSSHLTIFTTHVEYSVEA